MLSTYMVLNHQNHNINAGCIKYCGGTIAHAGIFDHIILIVRFSKLPRPKCHTLCPCSVAAAVPAVPRCSPDTVLVQGHDFDT
jgi:hypothetical protein